MQCNISAVLLVLLIHELIFVAGVDLFGASIRMLVEQSPTICSAFQWRERYEVKLFLLIADILNEGCAKFPARCGFGNLSQSQMVHCKFSEDLIDYPDNPYATQQPYPRPIDDYTLELRLFVAYKQCCHHQLRAAQITSADTPAYFLDRDAFIEMVRDSKSQSRFAAIGIRIVLLESTVVWWETALRRWSLLVGIGSVAVLIMGARVFLNHRQQAQFMNEFWQRTQGTVFRVVDEEEQGALLGDTGDKDGDEEAHTAVTVSVTAPSAQSRPTRRPGQVNRRQMDMMRRPPIVARTADRSRVRAFLFWRVNQSEKAG